MANSTLGFSFGQVLYISILKLSVLPDMETKYDKTWPFTKAFEWDSNIENPLSIFRDKRAELE